MNDDEILKFLSQRFAKLDQFNLVSMTYLRETEDNDICESWYDDIKETLGADWLECGCTKVVMHFLECPEVVMKVPLHGHMSEDDEWYLEDTTRSFMQADFYREDSPDNWDYCKAEHDLYHRAVAASVSEFFAPMDYLGNVRGFRVYTQPILKVYDIDKRFSGEHIKKAEKIRDSTKTKRIISKPIVAWFINRYGEEKTSDFLRFLNENDIDDLHSLNFGMTDNGCPKLLDYGGYRDDFF